MLTKQKKRDIVAELSSIVGSYPTVIFVDFSGLTTPQMDELKSVLRESDVSFRVTKKSLWPFAFREKEITLPDELAQYKGSLAAVYSMQEGVSAAKAIQSFSKDHAEITIVGGLLDGEFVGPESIVHLSTLPTLEELHGSFVGVLAGVTRSFVGVLQAPIRDTIGALNAIKDTK